MRILDPQVPKTIFQPLTPAQAKQLVQELEQVARDQPQRYRLQVGAVAILGYLYLLLVFGGLGLGLWLLREVCVALGLQDLLPTLTLVGLIIGLTIVRLFWLSIPKPKGIPLRSETVPQLFTLIQNLTQSLQTPSIHQILIIEDMNAAILQRPRLGILGWCENYLLLGLPLMQVLSSDQLKAVIAHELGHLSGNHSRFQNWIYRIRRTWLELSGQVDQRDATGWLFKRFFQWYGPFFKTYSFVLARANEYEADRIAAEQAGAKQAAEALIRINLFGYHWAHQEQMWSSKQAVTSADPPSDKMTSLLATLQELPSTEAQRWYARMLADTTDLEDTHPCLTARLKALNYPVDPNQLPDLPQVSAAEVLLDDQLPSLTQQLDQLWQRETAQAWKRFYEQTRVRQETLQDLEHFSLHRSLTADEIWKQAALIQFLQGSQAARPILETNLKQDPAHGRTHYHLGMILIKQGDSQGVTYLQRAMDLDPAYVIAAGEQLCQYYRLQGELAMSKSLEDRIQAHQSQWELALRERAQISSRDSLKVTQLSTEQILVIQRALSYYPDIRHAFLVQKQVHFFPERSCFILGLDRQFLPGQGADRKSNWDVIQELQIRISLPGDLKIEILDPSTLALFNTLKQIPGARISGLGT